MLLARRSKLRIWLIPLAMLAGAALCLLAGTLWVDALLGRPVAQGVWTLLIHPNPAAAANTLSSAGEVVAAVLAIALTVVAIIVELASNRYTHRVTELFVAEPVNFLVTGLFVITAVQALWVTLAIDASPGGAGIPYFSVAVTLAMLTTSCWPCTAPSIGRSSIAARTSITCRSLASCSSTCSSVGSTACLPRPRRASYLPLLAADPGSARPLAHAAAAGGLDEAPGGRDPARD